MWADLVDNPIHRFRSYLVGKSWWSEQEELDLLKKHKENVLTAFRRAEKMPKPKLGAMFEDVWRVEKGHEVPRVIVSGAGVGPMRWNEADFSSRSSRKPNWVDCSRSTGKLGRRGRRS